ncbi:phosphonate metabolism protein PhnP [Marinobacter sp. V034]|uniref:phosphonate metabolism protein PhnP n=1 Tax=Marinobacter sp. V034 TaxID=3459610 RepID=UPI0040444E5B
MKLTFLGTGDARQVPLYGCQCCACERALKQPEYRRTACSISLEHNSARILIDAGQHDLRERFPPGTVDAILLTHYHMDHVAGLFPLRWGVNCEVPVFGPDDPDGCDDLFKHPGILQFQTPQPLFRRFDVEGLGFYPVPLNHSKLCQGYGIDAAGVHIAYLTDTVGLPDETVAFLQAWQVELLIIDCTHAPEQSLPRNHNDWNEVKRLIDILKPKKTLLTHIGHEMDCWLMNNPLPASVSVARDNMQLSL